MNNLSQARNAIFLLLILLGAAFLRFHSLGSRDLWYDEVFTYDVSQNSPTQIIHELSGDTSPPLYFLMLKAWSGMFANVVNLRSLSIVWALLGIWGVYLLGSQLFSPGVGLYAALMLAVNPFHIYYSQELRMYTTYTTLLVFGAYFLIKSVTGQMKRGWLVASLFNALALYTHYHAIFFILGEYLYAWYVTKSKVNSILRKGLLCSLFVTGVAVLPLLPLVLTQAHNSISKIAWIPTPLLSDFPRSFFVAFSYYFYATQEAWWMWAINGLLFLILTWGNWGIWRDRITRPGLLFLVCTGILPVAIMFVLSYSPVKFFLASRFIIVSLIPFLLLLSVLLVRLQLRTQWIKSALLLTIAINGLAFAWIQNLQNNKPHWRKLTRIIDLEVRPDDPLVAVEDYWMNGYFHYSPYDHPIVEFDTFMQGTVDKLPRLFLLQYNKTKPEDAVFPQFLLAVLDQYSTSTVLFRDDWYTFSLHRDVDFKNLQRWYSLRVNASRDELAGQDFLAFLGAESASLDDNPAFGALQIDGHQSPYRWTIGEETVFHFPVTLDPGLYLLGLKARFSHPEEITDYNFEIEVNDCFYERRKAVNAYSPFYYYVLFRRPQNSLMVSCHTSTWVPKTYYGNNDERHLGFNFHWLSFANVDLNPFRKKGYLAFYDIGSPADKTLVNEGWYSAEHYDGTSFRWTWHTATITLPLMDEAAQVKDLVLNFISKYPESVTSPILQISINGVLMPPVTLENGWFERTIPVPPVFTPGPNKVCIHCPIWVPSETGDSRDARELGIQINWIALR